MVKQELERLGLDYSSIELGMVEMRHPLTETQTEVIQSQPCRFRLGTSGR